MSQLSTQSEILSQALDERLLGLGAIDENLCVIERCGPLSAWLPPPGDPCCDCALLYAMEPAFVEMRALGAAPLILPSVSADGQMSERVTIAISWHGPARRFIVATTPDEGTKALEALLFQDRREKQILQQQAAAASDRLRISATLYRDIVEATADVVLRLRPDLSLSFLNSPALRLLGGRAIGDEPVFVRDILPLPQVGNPWRADMCAQGQASFEQPLRRANGETAWLWWEVRWLGEDSGPAEFQAVGRDVTQLRRLRAELERANEAAQLAALAEERLRISHDLHDTLVHSIVNLQARLSLLRRAGEGGPLAQDLSAAENEAREGLRAARQALGAIRADLDDEGGVLGGLEAAAQALREKSGVEAALIIDPKIPTISPLAAMAIVRVAREALRNVALHSGAKRVEIDLRGEGDAVTLTIRDNGIGFDAGRGHDGHYGLVGMREQARLCKGELTFETAPGAGARVTLIIPSAANHKDRNHERKMI